jgi:hypothetical protein
MKRPLNSPFREVSFFFTSFFFTSFFTTLSFFPSLFRSRSSSLNIPRNTSIPACGFLSFVVGLMGLDFSTDSYEMEGFWVLDGGGIESGREGEGIGDSRSLQTQDLSPSVSIPCYSTPRAQHPMPYLHPTNTSIISAQPHSHMNECTKRREDKTHQSPASRSST